MELVQAIKKIDKRHALLVFPINNQKEPASLWAEFFPRTRMRWEWDDSGDNRVVKMWHLREELSKSGRVVYTKWYRGRATLFSKTIFISLLRILAFQPQISLEAKRLLQILEEESPLSTKELKKRAKLQGRALEGIYQKALKELWESALIVGFGEVDDGAFPSLALGASEVLFESLWKRAGQMSREEAEKCLLTHWSENLAFLKEFERLSVKKKSKSIDKLNTRKQRGFIKGEDLYIK